MSAAPHMHIARWHDHLASPTTEGLAAMIREDCVFHSPVVHTPQRGKALTLAYLGAASGVFGDSSQFQYIDEIVAADGKSAMFEFTAEMDGIHVNGIDIIHWDDDGMIYKFKVLVRPLKAINKVWEKMGEMLEAQKG